MGITRIRGSQLKDRTIEGIKIAVNTLKDEHIAADAAISESKLNINWAAHGSDILRSKKVVDYIQVNGTNVSGVSSIDVSALGIIPNTDPAVGSSSTQEGVIVDAPKNKVPLRDSDTGEIILANIGNSIDTIYEVYGRITFVDSPDGGVTPAKYVLSFYYFDPNANRGTGEEVPFTMPDNQKIDWQYLKRFNLESVSETFAANEKFIEGAADATAHLNIEQLAKDLYGSSWSLDRDGNANLSVSLKDQIANEVTRAQNAEITLQNNIDAEKAARIAGDQAIRNDLASTAPNKGASLIGIEDVAGVFTATTVEGALKELDDELKAEIQARQNQHNQHVADLQSTKTGKGASLIGVSDADLAARGYTTVEQALAGIEDRLTYQENNGGKEVTDTHTRDVASANGYFVAKTGGNAYSSLEERLIDIEKIADREFKEHDDIKTEVETARGTAASLNDRLNVEINANGTVKFGKQIHTHKKVVMNITSKTNTINMPPGEYFKTDGTLDVYVNGILQANGVNFIENTDSNGNGIGITFTDGDTLLIGDVVVLKYVSYYYK